VSDVRVASIRGNPTPEEIVAITVAVGAFAEQDRAAAAAAASAAAVDPAASSDWLSMWVTASRRSAQRAGFQRGPWRISGRLARRTRL
jgi:hypothetical protein